MNSFIVSSIFLMYCSYNFQFCLSHFLNFSFIAPSSLAEFAFPFISLFPYSSYSNFFCFFSCSIAHSYFLNLNAPYQNSCLTNERILYFCLLWKKSSEVRCSEILTHSQMGGGIVSCACTKFVSDRKGVLSPACSLQETEAFFLKVQKPTIWCSDE